MTALGLIARGIASAQAAPSDNSATSGAENDVPTAFNAPEPLPKLPWGSGPGRSFLVPAYEIPAFELLLNRFDHYAEDKDTYPWPWTNFQRNLHRQWVIDNDKFSTNQFLHPYQGAVYQGLARSAGLDFWQASAYTFAGSLLWEYSGENTAPSFNDQVASEVVVFGKGEQAISFEALTDAGFVLGSAAKHPYDLVTGCYSVHTNAEALRLGENNIAEIGRRLPGRMSVDAQGAGAVRYEQ
jgi:hypothetical protein